MKEWWLLEGRVGAEELLKMEKFCSLIVEWNRSIRLVGPKDTEGVREQIVDSLLPYLIAEPSFPLLDIGSGAGLPAIPIAILYPHAEVVCLEPRTKRVSFIRHAARTLGLSSVSVVEARADGVAAPEGMESRFSTVTARAVSEIETLLEWARPCLAPNGAVILGRGGEPVAPQVGGYSLQGIEQYEALKNMGKRFVVKYKKLQ